MNKLKNFALITALVISGTVQANPTENLGDSLESIIKSNSTAKNLVEMTKLAEERNTDIDVAFQNYLIAKKRVSIARAAFNPITTGHLLGMALGVSYLWTAIAVEAVISIPTKIYNVKTNKYLASAALYNTKEAHLALSNEMAHLYYDIATHEMILKTIDKEVEVLEFQNEKANHAYILNLKMEKVDIYNLYIEELAAIKTLLMLDPSVEINLAQLNREIKKSFLNNLNLDKIQDFAIVKSNEYKTNINMVHAAESNVKSVQWSILSFSGINFSYSARVKGAKIDKNIAELQKESVGIKVKNDVLVKFDNLDSAISIAENYSTTSKDSIDFQKGIVQMYQVGGASMEAVVSTSIGAIRDFRNKVATHYNAWSALNDFSKAANFKFSYADELSNAQAQVEKDELYDVAAEDFKIVKKSDNMNAMSLKVESSKVERILKVEYKFDNNDFSSQTSTRDTKDFVATFQKDQFSPDNFSGVATIYFSNGHEFKIKFNL